MASIDYWVWLSSLVQLRPGAKTALLERFGGAEEIFFAPKGSFASIPGISAGEAAILDKRDMGLVSRILEQCEIHNIRILTRADAAYPKRLKYISAPPAVLYVRGKLPVVDDEPVISVIGTRKPSVYGVKMARDMAYGITKCGGVVASGLTYGIDAAAAEAALLAGGPCLGVLGTAHEKAKGFLVEEVPWHGALISEYPPCTEAYKHFFRDRNRITAGLSMGVVVVEAPEDSGALLFANEANDQGKEIFAVPGNADSPNSVGTIALMQEGAKPVTCGWDVMCEFEGRFPARVRHSAEETAPQAVRRTTDRREKNKVPAPAEASKKDVDKPQGKDYIDLREQLSQLSEDQLKIITAIDSNATHIDDIIEATGLGTAKVLAQLTVLEIKGYVRREAGRRVTLNIAKK